MTNTVSHQTSTNTQKKSANGNKGAMPQTSNNNKKLAGNSNKRNSGSKKSPILIPPPLVQVDFGNGSRSASSNGVPTNNNGTSSSLPKNKLNKQPKSDSGSSYSYQLLPDGKKPDFGNGGSDPKRNSHGSSAKKNKNSSKNDASSEIMNLLRANSTPGNGHQNNKQNKSQYPRGAATQQPVSAEAAYAGSSFHYSSPSLISLPKPTF